MIILQSDNRVLTLNSAYSFILENYPSGTGAMHMVNTEGFVEDGFILLEDWGKEIAEIFRIKDLDESTGGFKLYGRDGNPATTKFAHSESTKVYALPYDQVRFFWTPATGTIDDENPEFSTANPLTGYIDIQPASWYTAHNDNEHSTGFGWFLYRNSNSLEGTQPSNPIPYLGFVGNTVAKIFDTFNSAVSTNELKLISMEDRFAWLNEAFALFVNKLNLNNVEYFVSDEITLPVQAGTAEYLLPEDFSEIVYVKQADSNIAIPFQNVGRAGLYHTGVYGDQPSNPYGVGSDQTRYFLRNRYIGLNPTPRSDTTIKLRYRRKAGEFTSISEYIDLPDNSFYALVDHMLYRAYSKFQNPSATSYLESFVNAVNHFIQSSVKRDAGLDSWEPARNSIV